MVFCYCNFIKISSYESVNVKLFMVINFIKKLTFRIFSMMNKVYDKVNATHKGGVKK